MDRGQKLEELLTIAFNAMVEAEQLTEEKIDIPTLFNVVGSYVTAKKNDKLGDDVVTPAEFFNEHIFPLVDTSELEVIEEEPDGSNTDT